MDLMKQDTPIKLSELIKDSRKKVGISQKELSEQLGYTSSQFISNWERGVSSPPMDKLLEICQILRISQSQIVDTIMYETEQTLLSHLKGTKKKAASK